MHFDPYTAAITAGTLLGLRIIIPIIARWQISLRAWYGKLPLHRRYAVWLLRLGANYARAHNAPCYFVSKFNGRVWVSPATPQFEDNGDTL